jgi:hypothetical protein
MSIIGLIGFWSAERLRCLADVGGKTWGADYQTYNAGFSRGSLPGAVSLNSWVNND